MFPNLELFIAHFLYYATAEDLKESFVFRLQENEKLFNNKKTPAMKFTNSQRFSKTKTTLQWSFFVNNVNVMTIILTLEKNKDSDTLVSFCIHYNQKGVKSVRAERTFAAAVPEQLRTFVKEPLHVCSSSSRRC
jgi:hypothetical protein